MRLVINCFQAKFAVGLDMRELLFKYSKYALVGFAVTVIAIGVRELAGALLPSDTPAYYTLSIFIAYICGFFLSYLGHKFISFNHVEQLAFNHARSMIAFLLIALLGMLATILVSLTVRYLLPIDNYLCGWADSFAFSVGILMSSIGTFWLNRAYTFRGR